MLNDYVFSSGVYGIDSFDSLFQFSKLREQTINTNFMFRLLIQELDMTDDIFFTGEQIKAKHFDYKNGVFAFAGVIHEKDYELIKLLKTAVKNKTFNQFIKNIRFVEAKMKNDKEVYVFCDYSFKGYIADFYEYYDNFGNLNFEFVICHRKVLYQEDILVKRMTNGILLIGKIEEPARITIPIAKNKRDYENKLKKGKLKNLQVGNTFWAIGGICLATIGIFASGVVLASGVTVAGVASFTITALFGANTIASNSYSIYLDYNDRDDEMDLDTLYNNPIKFSMGEFMVFMTNEKNRKAGHLAYHGIEIFLGTKGLKELAKGFKIRSVLKSRKISLEHPLLGELQGKEQVIAIEKLLFEGYQFADGINGVHSNYKGFNNLIEEMKSRDKVQGPFNVD